MAKNAIMLDIETKDIQKILDKIQNNNATEKALAEFRKLSALDKYKECVRYGNLMTIIDMNTTDGFLTFKTFKIYDTKFIFIMLSGNIIDYYELQ